MLSFLRFGDLKYTQLSVYIHIYRLSHKHKTLYVMLLISFLIMVSHSCPFELSFETSETIPDTEISDIEI